jgi:hypothetical protein
MSDDSLHQIIDTITCPKSPLPISITFQNHSFIYYPQNELATWMSIDMSYDEKDSKPLLPISFYE